MSYVYYRQQSNARTLLSYCACIQTIITHTIVIIRIYWHDSYISHKSAYHWSVSLFLVFWIKHSEDLPLRENLWDTVQNIIALYTVENTIVSYTVENTVENTVARYPFKVPLNCTPLKIPLHRTVQSTVDHFTIQITVELPVKIPLKKIPFIIERYTGHNYTIERSKLHSMVYHSMPRGIPFKIPLDEWYFQWFSMVKYTVQNTVGLITSKYHWMVLNGIFNGISMVYHLTDFYKGRKHRAYT